MRRAGRLTKIKRPRSLGAWSQNSCCPSAGHRHTTFSSWGRLSFSRLSWLRSSSIDSPNSNLRFKKSQRDSYIESLHSNVKKKMHFGGAANNLPPRGAGADSSARVTKIIRGTAPQRIHLCRTSSDGPDVSSIAQRSNADNHAVMALCSSETSCNDRTWNSARAADERATRRRTCATASAARSRRYGRPL